MLSSTQIDLKQDKFFHEKAKKTFQKMQIMIQQNGWQIDDLFKKFDKDKGGYLDSREFYNFLGQIDQSITFLESQYIFDKFDLNKDGKIDTDEFKQFYNKYDFTDSTTQAQVLINELKEIIKSYQLDIKDIFKNFDVDQGGTLSYEEFTQFIKVIAPAIKPVDIKDIFDHFDMNQDGSVTFEEFSQAILSTNQPPGSPT